MSKEQTAAFLQDLTTRRGSPSPGHNPIWVIELWGGKIIQPTAFEPDPVTHHDDYYYNAVTNTLYRRVVTQETPRTAYWQKASD
jgi:hypothetical protein